MNIIPAIAVIVLNEGSVLVVRHGEKAGHPTGTYGLPAGRIDQGETAIHAAVRELREEAGLEATENDLEEYPGNTYTADLPRKNGDTIRSTMTVFICQKYTGELQGSDETEPFWLELQSLQEYSYLPNVEKAIEDAVSYLKKRK